MTMLWYVAFATVTLAHLTLPSPTTKKSLSMTTSQPITSEPRTTSAIENVVWSLTFSYFSQFSGIRFTPDSHRAIQFSVPNSWNWDDQPKIKRFMQLGWGKNLVIRDSLMFLTSSLESLVESLCRTDEQQFNHLETLMGLKYPNAYFKLLFCKGVFLYEYFDLFEKFNEPALPHREAFYSTLQGEECSVKDFDNAQRVSTAFKCHSL